MLEWFEWNGVGGSPIAVGIKYEFERLVLLLSPLFYYLYH